MNLFNFMLDTAERRWDTWPTLIEEVVMDNEWFQKYIGASITNVRQGKDSHAGTTYAQIRDSEGGLLVSADLDYCTERMREVSKLLSEA